MYTQTVPHARSVTFLCGLCDHKLKAKERLRGTRVRCTRCQAVLVVPGAPEVEREEEEAGESWWSPLLWVTGGLLGIGLVLIGGVVLLASQYAARKETGRTAPPKPVAVNPAPKVVVARQNPKPNPQPKPKVEIEQTPKVMDEPSTKPVSEPQPVIETKLAPEAKRDPAPEPKTVLEPKEPGPEPLTKANVPDTLEPPVPPSTTAPLTAKPVPMPPIQPVARTKKVVVVGGSTFSGSENLRNYGTLDFTFHTNGSVTMYDADGSTNGSWQRNGNQVILRFYNGAVIYGGTLSGGTISGTARNSKAVWSWSVSLQ